MVSSSSPWIASVFGGTVGIAHLPAAAPISTRCFGGRCAALNRAQDCAATKLPKEKPASANACAGSSAPADQSRAVSMMCRKSSVSPLPSSCAPALAPTPRKFGRTAAQPAATNERANVAATLLSRVPPKRGCGWPTKATPTARFEGQSTTTSICPAGPATMRRSLRTVIAARFRALRRPWRTRSDLQAVDRLAMDDVAIDDLVDIVFVDVRVPDCFRVDDHAWSLVATIETPRLVDADLAWTGEAELLDALLGVRLHFGGVVVRAAG